MDYSTEKLRKLREDSNLTSEYMASRMRLSRSSYVRLELKQRQMQLWEAKMLADTFGLTVDELFYKR